MNRRLLAVGLAVLVGVASIAAYSIYESNRQVSTTSSLTGTISTQSTHQSLSTGRFSASTTTSKAVDYLLANWDGKGTGLIAESPGSSTFWLYSDNFLATLALNQYGRGNETILTIAGDMSRSMNSDLALRHLNGAENQYAVLNASVPCRFHPSTSYTVDTPDGVKIKTTLNNGTGELSEAQYADIAFLKAVCLYRQANATGAMTAYNAGSRMFDGVGFRDLPYNQTGQYQTYKLALYIYTSAILRQPFFEAALSALLAMQAQSGGFYTGYDASKSNDGTLTNTETTSLAILALSNAPYV